MIFSDQGRVYAVHPEDADGILLDPMTLESVITPANNASVKMVDSVGPTVVAGTFYLIQITKHLHHFI